MEGTDRRPGRSGDLPAGYGPWRPRRRGRRRRSPSRGQQPAPAAGLITSEIVTPRRERERGERCPSWASAPLAHVRVGVSQLIQLERAVRLLFVPDLVHRLLAAPALVESVCRVPDD